MLGHRRRASRFNCCSSHVTSARILRSKEWECTCDPPIMTSALRSCPRCGLEIPADAPEGACPVCLFENGLRVFSDAPVAAGGDCSALDSTGIPNKFGDFEITRREDGSLWELGRGGMGVTYLAVDNVLRREVALKVINVPAAARTSHPVRKRFLREARAAAALRHPNVAVVYRFGATLKRR